MLHRNLDLEKWHRISSFTKFIEWFIYAFCLRASITVCKRSWWKRFRFYSESSRSQFGCTPRQLQHFKQNKCPHKFAEEFRSHFKHFLFKYLSICLFSHFNLSCCTTVFLIPRYKSKLFTNLEKKEKNHFVVERDDEKKKKKYIFNRWSLISISTANCCRSKSCSTHYCDCDIVTNIIHIGNIFLLHTRTGAHFR